MNTLQSGMNEKVSDIYLLTASETVVPFTGHLKEKGYRVTLFSDGASLLETLRTGTPDLLIADATTMDGEAFEVCRHIKSDDDFRLVPVLILTHASVLSDILQVLDCNADNFIPYPFDLPAGLSVIESMLGTPVERQTPDQVKTRFKINLDDHIYSVAANRRKLLELLLSSFETVVNTTSELSHVKTELQTLSESARYLEDRVADQARLIDTIRATLHQKEQKISTLNHEIEEKKKLLAQKARKALVVTCDDTGHAVQASACPGTNTLIRQISELSHELETAKTNLDTVQEELEEEKIHHTSLECTLELLGQQKEYLEKTLRSVTEEHEQLVSAFEAERNRVVCAEQELGSVMRAKTQSEQELSLIINEFKGATTQHSEDLDRLKTELEREENQRISAENQLGTLRQEKEQSESFLRSSVAALNNQIEDLRGQLEITRTALATEENTTRSLKENLAAAVAEHEATRLREQEELESDKVTLEQQKCDLDTATSFLTTLEMSLGDIKIRNTTLVGELNLALQKQTQAELQVQWLTDELKKAREALDSERQHRDREESFEILVPAIRRTDQGLQSPVKERNRRSQFPENTHNMRVTPEDTPERGIAEPDLFEDEPVRQDLQVVADEPVHLQEQVLPMEGTAEIHLEAGQAGIVKDLDNSLIAESSPPANVVPACPESQKSPDGENELAPSKGSLQITEVTSEAVSDIIDFFGEEDSCESSD